MTTYWRVAALGGRVTATGAALAYATTFTGPPTTETGVGFLVAAALVLLGYVFGTRHVVLAVGWGTPATAGVLVLVEPTTEGLREVSLLVALLGLGTAVAWPAVNRGLAVANEFGERFWREN